MPGDASLPDGWRQATVRLSAGLTRKHFQAPDGSVLLSRNEARQYLIKCGKQLAHITGYDSDQLPTLYHPSDKNGQRKKAQLRLWPAKMGNEDPTVDMIEDRLVNISRPRRLASAVTFGPPQVSHEEPFVLLLEETEKTEEAKKNKKQASEEEVKERGAKRMKTTKDWDEMGKKAVRPERAGTAEKMEQENDSFELNDKEEEIEEEEEGEKAGGLTQIVSKGAALAAEKMPLVSRKKLSASGAEQAATELQDDPRSPALNRNLINGQHHGEELRMADAKIENVKEAVGKKKKKRVKSSGSTSSAKRVHVQCSNKDCRTWNTVQVDFG